MKIYTRTGDDGQTGLFGGRRVPKTHPRVEAYGTIDELNAALGLAVTLSGDAALRDRLQRVQARLFDVAADIATPPDAAAGAHLRRVETAWVTALEDDIDLMSADLPALTQFILPGGVPPAAALQVARTVCRRAERRATEARASGEPIGPVVPAYLNRLSDWLFVAARWANHRADVADVLWRPDEA